MINPEITGKFIAQCRKEKQMTQKQLGEQLGVTDRAVSKWETGKSFPDIALWKISAVFLISVSANLLQAKKLLQNNYHEETERLLAESVSNSQLYGYQIVIYTLEFAAITLFGMSFTHQCIQPRTHPGNVLAHHRGTDRLHLFSG